MHFLIKFCVPESFFDEIQVRRLTFSRKGVHGRFGWPLGAQHESRDHAPGRLGAPFWEAFSIKNRLKIYIFFDIIFDMIFDRFLIDFWRLFGSKIDDFWITFSK